MDDWDYTVPETLGSLPLGAIPPNVSRLMAEVTCHLTCLTRNPDLALALMVVALSLKPLRTRNLRLLSRTRRGLTLPSLATSVATLKPDPTQLADPISKVSRPESPARPKGRSEPKPGLLRRFHFSYQTFIYVISF